MRCFTRNECNINKCIIDSYIYYYFIKLQLMPYLQYNLYNDEIYKNDYELIDKK